MKTLEERLMGLREKKILSNEKKWRRMVSGEKRKQKGNVTMQ